MRAAVVHYHFRRGGVTSVANTASAAMAGRGIESVFICGEDPGTALSAPVIVDPDLAYGADADPAALHERIMAAFVDRTGARPDVWHIHNHSLGKNVALPRLVQHLAHAGEKILLHTHDFAEDCRGSNYRYLMQHLGDGTPTGLQQALYPCGPHIHYAALTSRDAAALRDAGVPEENVHVLSNPASAPPVDPATDRDASIRTYVYPVRAIRRKNIGELLMWSAALGDRSRFMVTLPPTSDVDMDPYTGWKNAAAALGLHVEFEAGKTRDYAEVMAMADAVITTSIAEGFGLVYAEPWLAGIPVVGRRIPGVTRDLEAAGLKLDHLYGRFPVPLEWIGEERLAEQADRHITALYADYGIVVPDGAAERVLRAIVIDGQVDAGRLDESLQAVALDRLAADPAAVRATMESKLEGAADPETTRHNRAVIERAFSPDAYGERLGAIYSACIDANPGPVTAADKGLLTDSFLCPESLFMLRT